MKAWPIDPLLNKNLMLEVSEKLPQGLTFFVLILMENRNSIIQLNNLSYAELESFWTKRLATTRFWEVRRHTLVGDRVILCTNLEPVKSGGKPQIYFNGLTTKPLVHALWWRWENRNEEDQTCPLIDVTLHLSHIDCALDSVTTILESRDVNESRKYCALFNWFAPLPGEVRPRCPHWEIPCSGPCPPHLLGTEWDL